MEDNARLERVQRAFRRLLAMWYPRWNCDRIDEVADRLVELAEKELAPTQANSVEGGAYDI